ncbi:hypothetical protein [Novosphingobium rosa]|uniref:hypothetical protein n=1 Tax=Novosphingobium rosa TaxID=76978 RepID=UPI00082A2AC0|nr:hypothetical protein [Novosphingobium rosa]
MANALQALPGKPGAFTAITQWDGTLIPMAAFPTVVIWCWVAPTAPATIMAGDGTNMIAQSAVSNTAAGMATTSTISAPGRYTLPGGSYLSLLNAAGGSFSICGVS